MQHNGTRNYVIIAYGFWLSMVRMENKFEINGKYGIANKATVLEFRWKTLVVTQKQIILELFSLKSFRLIAYICRRKK